MFLFACPLITHISHVCGQQTVKQQQNEHDALPYSVYLLEQRSSNFVGVGLSVWSPGGVSYGRKGPTVRYVLALP